MTSPRQFAQVDVFASQPYAGNPVAVILDADGLTAEEMQRIARWTNLSETTFVQAPTDRAADYRVRIFTQTKEIPFAGHPTLGTARAWLNAGRVPATTGTIVQECAAGLIELRHCEEQLSFAAPPTIRTGSLEQDYLDRIASALGIPSAQILDHQWVDNGPGWAAVRLADAEAVLALEPDFSDLPEAMVGVVGAHPHGAPHDFELRAFAPAANVVEDPVTGSLNASVAQWLIGTGRAPRRYTAAQGTRLGRAGEIVVTSEGDRVWIGGNTTVLFNGTAIA
ncbi:PhzF family phenazine biosynthesis protein [Brevibacterium sediminis]|uniref:PhzF family phenazine biosynthesis protein n=1 Tax=Brevibacterium sediminis TaxID=1857024 RepID=A0A5C4X2Q5_9MICO|nr:PhzF family phenazine biosynthesis protein [Brevibacterium sediminis]TNM55838.1 PhzF family phenazine biosynthesis protein [Brevibacterium sediminis]